ncbi:MAG: phosphoadenosine phosphosulfate reductase family protein [Defluviitaleaceae bacterium]|nr:phosphoadenosine phosphosulfate reductase family protein [Defluviitaleaceae bacterium]
MLNSSPTKMSKEPRPVYAPELDLLGFNHYWKYDNQTDVPYMWAEANRYWYRGRPVASLKGGNVYNAPEIQLAYVCKEWRETQNGKTVEKTFFEFPSVGETVTDKKGNIFILDTPVPKGKKLRPVDIEAMVEANKELLGIIEATTVKKILAVYEKYANKLDVFHVAFSGGKDSCVLLDLCTRALPKDGFIVVFGDTMMEFPDTYDLINEVEGECKREGIDFHRAYSHMKPEESWIKFGPPSRSLRWCCSVHKSAPQTLKLREVLGKPNYTGLDYVGVRAEESLARSGYEYDNFGTKQKGQHAHNSILEWTSAEIWLYIYTHNIIINTAYKKGNSRAGCLFCPMSSGSSDFIRRQNYTNDVDSYIDIITQTNDWEVSDSELMSYVANGGWDARHSGRGLKNNPLRYSENTKNGSVTIELFEPLSNWQEWIKTIDTSSVDVKINSKKNGFIITVNEEILKYNPAFGKLLRQVFRKTAYCVGCKVCEQNCRNGCCAFVEGQVQIRNCVQCGDCHDLSGGCLAYNSLKKPQGEKKMKTINCYDDHAPKTEWLLDFFKKGNVFFRDNDLGPNMFSHFRKFLREALVTKTPTKVDNRPDKNDFVLPFGELILDIGWDTDAALGLMLINLAHESGQFEWYIKELEVGRLYSQQTVIDMLLNAGVKQGSGKEPYKAHKSIFKSYKRIVETPFGTKLNFGYISDDADISRTTCNVSDPRVILYGLYVYNDKANAHHEFRLNTLYENLEQDGIPPTTIFGLDRQAMEPILRGLSAKYPELINYSDTNDLCKISLRENKTPQDVLDLFKEGR